MPFLNLAGFSINIYAAPMFAAAAVAVLIGLIVLARERVSAISLSFFVLTAAITIWVGGVGMMYLSTTPGDATDWARFAHLGITALAAALYGFVVRMLGIYRRVRWIARVAWLGAVVFLIAALTSDLLLDGVNLMPWGYYARYQALGVPFAVFTLGLISVAMVQVLNEIRKPTAGHHSVRLRWLLVALILGVPAAFDFIATSGSQLYPFGWTSALGFMLVIGPVILRYHLVDITPAFAAPTIIETMTDGLMVLDADEVIRLVNPASARMLGYEEDELVEHRLQDLVHDALFAAEWSRLLQEGSFTDREVTYHTRDDRRRVFAITTTPMDNGLQQPLATVLMIRDVTVQKTAEVALEKNLGVVELLRIAAIAANEADTVQEAMQTCLDVVCEITGWPIGHYYVRADSDKDELVSSGLWHIEDTRRFKPFTRVLSTMRFGPHSGLPGMVLATGKPAWVTDLLSFDMVMRARIPHSMEIGATFAFPVLVGAEVVGVMEFFSTSAVEPDDELLEVMGQLGTQLGRVVERQRAQQQISRLNDDLEQRIAERTVELEVANRILQNEVVERKRAEAALHELATLDDVTGLINRREFNRVLKDEVYRAQRYMRPLVLLMGDLDHFKNVNDTHGHQVGDAVLRWVSQMLRNNLRSTDRVARYGGEELAVVLPETALRDAYKLAEHLRALVSAEPFLYVKPDGTIVEVPVTISFGLARLGSGSDSDDALITAADTALYEAKRSGRNRTVMYSPELLPARPAGTAAIDNATQLLQLPTVPNPNVEKH